MPLSDSYLRELFSLPDDEIKTLLPAIFNLNLRSKSESDRQQIVMLINTLLSMSLTRKLGLEYLNTGIRNCSSDIIAQNGLMWINSCLTDHQVDNLKEQKLLAIGKIIVYAHDDDEFSTKFVSDYITKVFELCLSTHVNPDEVESALGTLAICIKYYSNWFTIHKPQLEQFFVDFLDSSWKNHIEKAAVAFHFLQLVGDAGIDGNNPRTNFSTNFHKFCVTIHTLFDTFFENENEIIEVYRTDEDGFSFKSVHCDSQKMVHITARRIRNCLKFVTTMILEGFPVVKDITPLEVLDVIIRGTALHHCLSGDDTKSLLESQFSLLLNDVQIKLLGLLRVFVIWCKISFLPFIDVINKILIDCLHRCQNCSCFKSNSLYQESVYKGWSDWLRIMKGCISVQIQQQVLTCILKDIIPVESQVDATTSELTTMEEVNRENNCLFALDTLKYLVTYTVLKDEMNFFQDVYSSILNVLMNIRTANIFHPYTNIKCQIKLYEVLVALYKQDNSKFYPPLHLILDGVNDENRHISSICERGLSILEKICQPICPPWNMPEVLYVQSENNNVNEESVKSPKENTVEGVQDNAVENETGLFEEKSVNDSQSRLSQKKRIIILANQIIKLPRTELKYQENAGNH